MSNILVVTDSMVSFPTPDFLSKHEVEILPVSLSNGLTSYQDIPGASPDEYHEVFEHEGRLPTIESPSIEQFSSIYEKLQRETSQILSLHTSAAIGDTYSNAKIATEQYLGRCDIQVVDSHSVSIGLGILIEAAVQAIDKGETLDEVVLQVRELMSRLYMVFIMEDLGYLQNKELVSKSQSVLGNMLGIIPFVTVEDGKLVPMEKVRNRPQALEKMLEFVGEFARIEHLALIEEEPGGADGRWLTERLTAMHPRARTTVSQYGPSLKALFGPGCFGLAVLERNAKG